ncbi:hypothetical protein JK636_07270 [Clostridium sp. YIM B02515]|uniref:Uncharacterized protein n=1 Tax=Clostridium rhizosphaerae TaxID=2803861 RepID=A0ABS1TC43_9CLOT|nr:hypothetical protein [Clostridium rhizosphaerae]MBL4935558.1 hypothetical protein [Clostridium rhizosphaerae]
MLPRPMLKLTQQNKAQTNNVLSVTNQEQKNQITQMDKMKLDRILRQRRSKEYMDALNKLDVGGHVHNQEKVNNIINVIKSEFPEVQLSGILLGYVSVCYLGRPYEVHILDITGGIIEHFEAGHSLPNGMEKARSIAMRGGYDFIEVYVDCCRAVSSNGTVSVISGL